jgi:FixJ family two-component response regulator
VQRGLSLGAVDFISKPVSSQQLATKIAKYLAQLPHQALDLSDEPAQSLQALTHAQ